MGIESATGHLLVIPIRHVYALLWRVGILTVERKDN